MSEFKDWFWSKVLLGDDCWEWTGSGNGAGHGKVYDPRVRKTAQAHRVAYEDKVGPIPTGAVIDHLCRNRGCVRPDHLEPVRQRVNVERGDVARFSYQNSETCKNGHPWAGNLEFKKSKGTLAGLAPRCVECKRAGDRKSSCKRGHPFTPENAKIASNGKRVCMKCVNDGLRPWVRKSEYVGEAEIGVRP